MPHNRPTHLRLVTDSYQAPDDSGAQNWVKRFAHAAMELLRAPSAKSALFSTAAVMATTYAATGNIDHTLGAGAVSSLGIMGIGMTGDNLQPAAMGAALSAVCLLGSSCVENWVDQQRQAADPLPIMRANKELGPTTVIFEVPLTRGLVEITTVVGKRDYVDVQRPDGDARLECTRYWVVQHKAMPRDQVDNPELRQFDFAQPKTAELGDCAAIDSYRKTQLEYAIQHSQTPTSRTPRLAAALNFNQ